MSEKEILTPKQEEAIKAKELRSQEEILKKVIESKKGTEFTVIGRDKKSLDEKGRRKKIKRSGNPVRVTALKHCGPAGYAYFEGTKFWIDSEEASELSRHGYVEK